MRKVFGWLMVLALLVPPVGAGETIHDCQAEAHLGACMSCMEEIGYRDLAEEVCETIWGCPDGADCEYASNSCGPCCLVCA